MADATLTQTMNGIVFPIFFSLLFAAVLFFGKKALDNGA